MTLPRQTRKKAKQLFNNPIGKPKTRGIGYGSAEKARRSLALIKDKPLSYQKQVAITMYYRAKYHKYQTKGMREAQAIYKDFLDKSTPRKEFLDRVSR